MQYIAIGLALGVLAHAAPSAVGRPGDSCQPQTIFCADGDGKSPRYLKCIRGRLVESFCVNSSICIGSKGTTIFCAANDADHAKSVAAAHTLAAEHSSAPAPVSGPSAPQQQQQQPEYTPAASQAPVPDWHPEALPSRTLSLSLVHSPPAPSDGQWNLHPQPSSILSTAPSTSAPVAPLQHTPLPPALQSQIWPYSQPPATSAGAHGSYPPFFAGVPRTTRAPYMLDDHHPIPVFEAPPASDPENEQEPAAPQAPAAAEPGINGMDTDKVMSIIGSAVFSQHPELLSSGEGGPAPRETGEAVDQAPMLDQVPAQALAPGLGPAAPRTAPDTCSAGNFVCEAHGLRPGYFACDSISVPLPASCGATDVCYQAGRSIICGAPGGSP